jgi:tetratricopeptide (TPR) repeat protein
VFTTFWLEYRLWGLNPVGYHAVNIILHAVNAIIVFWLLRRLEVPGAWMIGAVFAVHPVHVESVAWISERKNVLSALFYLLSIGCYLEYESKRRWGWYAGALGLFILALLSKTVVATLPVAFLLIRYFKGWRIGRREVLELLPFLVIGAAMGLLTKWYEVHRVGAEGPEWDLSMGESLLVAGRALVFYVVKLIWPTNLSFNYPRWQLDIRDPMQWSWVLVVLLVGLVFWWKRAVWGRGPFVGLAFFSVSLSPALGFFDVYFMRFSFVADHFQYLASLGIIALFIGSTAWEFDRRIKSDPNGEGLILKWMRPVPGLLVLVILAALTWKQGQIYRNPGTLWQDTLNKNPNSWLAHNNLGSVYVGKGDLEEAIQEYLAVLSLQPNYATAHYDLGTIYLRQGRLEEAIQEFLTALRLQPFYVNVHNNLGNAYLRQGRLEEAIQEFLTVLGLQPDLTQAHYNLGNAYKLKGLEDEARKQFEMALKLNPNFSPAQEALESLGSQPKTQTLK